MASPLGILRKTRERVEVRGPVQKDKEKEHACDVSHFHQSGPFRYCHFEHVEYLLTIQSVHERDGVNR